MGLEGDDTTRTVESFTVGNTLYAKLQRFAGKFGVEQRGIERVPEDERTDTRGALNIATMVRISKSRGSLHKNP
jgi:hypothetical protein